MLMPEVFCRPAAETQLKGAYNCCLNNDEDQPWLPAKRCACNTPGCGLTVPFVHVFDSGGCGSYPAGTNAHFDHPANKIWTCYNGKNGTYWADSFRVTVLPTFNS